MLILLNNHSKRKKSKPPANSPQLSLLFKLLCVIPSTCKLNKLKSNCYNCLMKFTIVILSLIINLVVFGQSKKELRSNIYDLTNKYDELNENYIKLDKKYNALKEKYSVSFDTPENYVESLFKLLQSKNKNEASKLLLSLDDTNFFSAKLSQVIKEEADRDSISVSDWIQNLNDNSKNSFYRVHYEGLNLGIKWENAIFKKAEFKIEYDDDLDAYEIDNYKVFFRYLNKDYYFGISDAFIINDKPNNWELYGPYDIQAQKLEKEKRERQRLEREKQKKIELQNKPYTPWNLSVGKATWTYYDLSKKTFANFKVKISNNTKFYVKTVKFRVSISTDGQGKVFSRTYFKSVYLEPGDVKTIQIAELSDFYVGEDLSNQDNWDIDYNVIEVYPKHHN